MSSRVYIGRLPSRATERDVEHFCRKYGHIREVVLKEGFGFVEFDDSRDADDAVHDLNGRELCGDRVIVELSRRGPRGGGGDRGYGGDRRGGGFGGGDRGGRFGPPVQTRYRIIVENLSSRCSWQDLKDMMRKVGEVTFADAHKKERNEGIVCFASREDLRRAMDRFQGEDVNGRRIKLIDDSEGGGGGGRGRSRSRSPRGRSRSRSSRKRSRSGSRSRSRSPKSRSRSPPSKKKGSGGGGSRSRSRSRSASSKRSRSGSPPAENGN